MKKLLPFFFLIAGCSYLSAQGIFDLSGDAENPRAELTQKIQQRLAARITVGSGIPFLALDSMIIPEYAKRFYTYDEQGRVIEAIRYSIPIPDDDIPIPFGPTLRQISIYNPNQLVLINYSWNDVQMVWKLRTRSVYNLDSNGNIEQYTFSVWFGNPGIWQGRDRQTYIDTPEGYDHIQEYWSFSTDDWIQRTKKSYFVNPENLVTQKASYLPGANGWVPTTLHEYAYNADKQKTEEIVTGRNEETGVWTNDEKITIAYHVSGQESEYARYSWRPVTGAWAGHFRITHAYYPDSTLALVERYNFDESQGEWILKYPTNGFFYTYAPDGRLSEKIEWRWYVPTQALAPCYRETFAYDSDGNLIDYVYFLHNTSDTTWRSKAWHISTFDLTVDVADLILPDDVDDDFNYYSELFRNAKLVSLETLAFNNGANDWQPDKTATYYFSELLTATAEAPTAETLKLFPNPVTNLLTPGATAPRASSYQITDLNGRILQQEKFWNGEGIDVSRLIPGSYVIRLIEGNRVITGKFIKL